MADLTWLEAIKKVMQKSDSAMHYTEIAEEIINEGYRKEVGATPANTVYSVIRQDINNRGSDSEFVFIDKGYFWLRSKMNEDLAPTTKGKADGKDVAGGGIIQAFGMFWSRDRVIWEQNTILLGQQNQGSKIVNFGDQIGVYVLYDINRPVYAGRAIDQGFGRRLFQHTFDRLNGRWNRFSWFGIKGVSDDGSLTQVNLNDITADGMIATMEALLIETLEPALNRKRGDDFTAVEYLQSEDPRMKDLQLANVLAQIQGRLQLSNR